MLFHAVLPVMPRRLGPGLVNVPGPSAGLAAGWPWADRSLSRSKSAEEAEQGGAAAKMTSHLDKQNNVE